MKLLSQYISAVNIWVLALFMFSCKKQDNFLDAKPDNALSTVSSLQDCQLLLQNDGVFNLNDPAFGTISSGEFYVSLSDWTGRSSIERNLYIWAKDIYDAGATVNDWNNPYNEIYYANTILDALSTIKINPGEENEYNQIKGTALFYRAYNFYNLLQTFALPYDSATATTELGIPLRLTSDLNVKSIRASEKECYDQVLTDLQTAITLLPLQSPYNTRPNKVAANALLARIYLAIGNYKEALFYSDAALQFNSSLVDYNTLTPTSTALTTGDNYLSEDIFHATISSYTIFAYTRGIVDSTLYNLYSSDDLRKSVFFALYRGQIRFKGSYEFKIFGLLYSGLATDEMYLIRAECNARMGNISPAMNDLNTLLVKRYLTGTFVSRTATGSDDALNQILIERRKELLFRGLRWTDLRRLNKDSRFAVTLTRVVNGTAYTLSPNDPKYALPIPDNEIQLSGIQQNPR